MFVFIENDKYKTSIFQVVEIAYILHRIIRINLLLVYLSVIILGQKIF